MNEWFTEFVQLARRNSLACVQRLMQVVEDAEDPRHVIAASKIIIQIATSKEAMNVTDQAFDEYTPEEQYRILKGAIEEVQKKLTMDGVH